MLISTLLKNEFTYLGSFFLGFVFFSWDTGWPAGSTGLTQTGGNGGGGGGAIADPAVMASVAAELRIFYSEITRFKLL
jgi:hypothetical protein